MKRPALLLVVVALTWASACGDDNAKPAPAAATAAERNAKAGVTVQDLGPLPRRALVLRLRAGDVVKRAMVTKLALELTIEGERAPIGTLPGTKVVLEQRIDRVESNGAAHFTAVFADITVVPAPGVAQEVIAETEKSVAQLKGARLTGVVGTNGASQGLSFSGGQVTDPTLKQLLDSLSSQIGDLSTPFPAEPLGVGARWATKKRATLIGLAVDTTTTYTLSERAGDRYTLDYTQTFAAVPGAVTLPGVPAGADARVERFDMRGNGRQTSLLTQALPSTSTGTATGDASFAFIVDKQRRVLTEHITAQVALSPA